MSSTAPQLPPVAPGTPGTPGAPYRVPGEGGRPLRAVPPGRVAASRLPFVILVTALLLGGVVGLLLFNTSMQQASFTETKLQEQATNLAAREQTMKMELQRKQDPQEVARKARDLGMVIPQTPGMIQVPSGKVSGEAAPSTDEATPPLYPKNPPPAWARMAEKNEQGMAARNR